MHSAYVVTTAELCHDCNLWNYLCELAGRLNVKFDVYADSCSSGPLQVPDFCLDDKDVGSKLMHAIKARSATVDTVHTEFQTRFKNHLALQVYFNQLDSDLVGVLTERTTTMTTNRPIEQQELLTREEVQSDQSEYSESESMEDAISVTSVQGNEQSRCRWQTDPICFIRFAG